MVERYFRTSPITGIRHGIFRAVEELILAIGEHVDQHNDHPTRFVWTGKATDILEKYNRHAKRLILVNLLAAPH